MFGIGLQELFFIAILAVIVFGPERMPELARQVAQFLHMARGYARRAQSELRSELGPEYADLTLRDLDPRQAIRRHVREALAELDMEERESTMRAAEAAALGEATPALPTPYDTEAT